MLSAEGSFRSWAEGVTERVELLSSIFIADDSTVMIFIVFNELKSEENWDVSL